MSTSISDGFEDVDSAYWDEVDAIEARALQQDKPTGTFDDSVDQFDSFALDDAVLAELDRLEAAATQPPPNTHWTAPASKPLSKQTTLLGGFVQPPPKAKPSQGRTEQGQAAKSTRPNKTKIWPKDAFTKNGWRIDRKKEMNKGKRRDESDEEEAETIAFEQFPEPVMNGESRNGASYLKLTG
jgi:hypothetical protein